jgi:hypothetical protein
VNRIVLGALAGLLLVGAGVFWWQGRAETERGADLPQAPLAAPETEGLPDASGAGLRGPAPPEVDEFTREQRRFDRLDRNRDGKIDRNEMLSPRVPAFRKLDKDGNNLLSFEEWAVATSDRFRGADASRDGSLSRAEFATTKPKRSTKPRCDCPPARAGKHAAEPESDDEGDEPAR